VCGPGWARTAVLGVLVHTGGLQHLDRFLVLVLVRPPAPAAGRCEPLADAGGRACGARAGQALAPGAKGCRFLPKRTPSICCPNVGSLLVRVEQRLERLLVARADRAPQRRCGLSVRPLLRPAQHSEHSLNTLQARRARRKQLESAEQRASAVGDRRRRAHRLVVLTLGHGHGHEREEERAHLHRRRGGLQSKTPASAACSRREDLLKKRWIDVEESVIARLLHDERARARAWAQRLCNRGRRWRQRRQRRRPKRAHPRGWAGRARHGLRVR